MSVNRWLDKVAVIHIYSRLLFSHKTEHFWVSTNEVDEPRAYFRESSKSERENKHCVSVHECGIWKDGTDDLILGATMGFSGGSDSTEPACNEEDLGLIPGVGKIPGRREWQASPVFLPWKRHRQWILADYSPWGHSQKWLSNWAYEHMFPSNIDSRDSITSTSSPVLLYISGSQLVICQLGTFGKFWKHIRGHTWKRACSWHLVGRVQTCCYESENTSARPLL